MAGGADEFVEFLADDRIVIDDQDRAERSPGRLRAGIDWPSMDRAEPWGCRGAAPTGQHLLLGAEEGIDTSGSK